MMRLITVINKVLRMSYQEAGLMLDYALDSNEVNTHKSNIDWSGIHVKVFTKQCVDCSPSNENHINDNKSESKTMWYP